MLYLDLNSFDEQPDFIIVDDHHVLNEHDDSESVKDIGIAEDQVSTIIKPDSNVESSPTIISPSTEVFINPPVPQDRRSKEKHIELVNIFGEPQAGIEPKKLIEALKEEGWIIAMQEELNQFERNKVWNLVPIPHGKTIIETKWIWKNTMDEHRVIVKNKARVVTQGLEAIRIFLAYTTYMGFVVFQMDVKSSFLNGKISGEVLKEAPRAWYETLSKFLLQEKFVRGVSVNETLFRGMIGSLMYLTASRPNIQFSTCLCASFDLKAYSDSDYVGCNIDRKSTLGGCQIIGGKLICWSATKQSSMAMSLTEVEYVAATRCYAQVL
ncbi:retrovirus-related pol polyprotein from transposon TNT 1-94 [Tanacetum coccineum]